MEKSTNKTGALENRIELSGQNDAVVKNDKSISDLKPIEPIQGQPPAPIASAHRLPWWPIAGALALVLIGVALYGALGTLTISSNPTPDKITVNGKTVSPNKKLWRLPGLSAKVTIEKQGYVAFEKQYSFGYNTDITLSPKLKQLPVAKTVSKDVSAPVALDKDSDGVKSLSANKQYILKIARETAKANKLNLEPIAGISSFQMPAQQNFVLLNRAKEIGVLDFARQNVTSQSYKTYADNIISIALSPDGKETFYLEHNNDTNQNYLTRDDISHSAPDRYFDEAMLKKLGISKPSLKWSPDGKTVMSVDKQIVLISTLNRKADKVVLGSSIADAWFVPGSSTVLALTNESKLVSFDSAKIPSSGGEDANPPSKTSYLHQGANDFQFTNINFQSNLNNSIHKKLSFREVVTTRNLMRSLAVARDDTTASISKLFTPSVARAAEDKTNLGFVDHNVNLKPNTVAVVDSSNIVAVNSKNQLIGYDFVSKKQSTYLLSKDVDAGNISTVTVDAKRSIVYLLVGNTLFSQALESSNY